MMGLLQINWKHMVSASQQSLIFFMFSFMIIKTNDGAEFWDAAQLLQQTDQLLFILLSTTGEPLFESIHQTSESDISNLAI